MPANFLKTKAFIIPAAILLAVMLFFFTRQLQEKAEVDREISQLESEIAALEGKNREIAELIRYFQTQDYRERQARSLLKLQKEGEFAVALPNRNEPKVAGQKKEPEDARSNLMKWWEYFFADFARTPS